MESSHKKKTILLLDEIDKADVRVDSFMLNFLQDGEIFLPQLGEEKGLFTADSANLLVIITKNDQREVSGPLLRRCRVTYMAWPSMDVERKILRCSLPFMDNESLDSILEIPHFLRSRPGVKKPPSTPEMVRLANDIFLMMHITPGVDKLNIGRYYINSIAQNPSDQEIVSSHKSPIFLGSRIFETFSRLTQHYTPPPGDQSVVMPIPEAIIHERH
jgi:MoxR-like ATPase